MRETSKTSASTESSARAWNCFWRSRTAAQIGLQCPPSGEQNVKLRSVVSLPEENVAFCEVNRRAQRHELVQVFGLELLEKGAPVQYHRFISHKFTSETSAANIKYQTSKKVKHINIQFGCLFLQGRGPKPRG